MVNAAPTWFEKSTAIVVVVAAVLVAVPTVGVTQPVDSEVALSFAPANYTGSCVVPPEEGFDCSEYSFDMVKHAADPMFFYVGLMREGGFPIDVGGAQFGITYDATVTVTNWALCTGGGEIPEAGWPDSGTGNAVTWGGGCYGPPAEMGRIGFFVTRPPFEGVMSLTPDPRIGKALWATCDAELFELCDENLQSTEISGVVSSICGDGCAVPTEFGTWSRLKRLH